MMIKQQILANLRQIGRKWWARKVNADPEMKAALEHFFPNAETIHESLFLLEHGYDSRPLCKECRKPVKWHGRQFPETCSRECREQWAVKTGNKAKAKAKARETNLTRFGVENPLQCPTVKEKARATRIAKYGEYNSPATTQGAKERVDQLLIKGRETLRRKYGVDNPGQIPGHGERNKQTMRDRYGVDHWSQTPERIFEREQRRAVKYSLLVPETITVTGREAAPQHRLELFENPNERISFVCEVCHTTDTIPSETLKFRIREFGTPCKECSGIITGSVKQHVVTEYVKSLLPGEQIVTRDRNLIYPQELDIYIPGLKLAIEFCGLYWHNEGRVGKDYHLAKYKRCKELDIRLIQIFEDEWDYRQKIVETRLATICRKRASSLGARKTVVRPVSSKIAREFCDQHHIQGYANASVRYGLYHHDDLVAVMTFALPSRAKGRKTNAESAVYELSRFCTSRSIAGAGSKLFKHFLEIHAPQHVFTYSDLRWNTGALYQRLGFTYKRDTVPNYWYVQRGSATRIHRFALRKSKSDPVDMTERELREAQGYLRIWDCGHQLWEWHNK